MTELLRRPLEVGIEATLVRRSAVDEVAYAIQEKEAEAQAHCFASPDFVEGIAAVKGALLCVFSYDLRLTVAAEKRQPNF